MMKTYMFECVVFMVKGLVGKKKKSEKLLFAVSSVSDFSRVLIVGRLACM